MVVKLSFVGLCSVYYPDRNQPITEGHKVLEKTLGGVPADLNLFGRISTYLTFKRGLLYGHTPAITDIVIIGKVLEYYVVLDVTMCFAGPEPSTWIQEIEYESQQRHGK